MRKRVLSSLAAILILCVLTGCSQPSQPVTQSDHFSILGFGEFLNAQLFFPGIGQHAFLEQLEIYRYEGQPVTDLMTKYHYDGTQGGGLRSSGRVPFGMWNDYTVCFFDQIAVYRNEFYTSVSLEGLELPYGLTFGDSLDAVAEKLGIAIDPKARFFSGQDEELILYSEKGKLLRLQNSENSNFAYELHYIENARSVSSKGQSRSVVRTVQLFFLKDNHRFDRVKLSVTERYVRK